MPSTHHAPRASERLRRGPDGLLGGEVAGIQRSRILAAAVDAVEEVGYARMTVAQVISRAKVSRKTFYDVFTDREDCFLAAFEQTLEEARGLAKEAFDGQQSWREGVRAALARLLSSMEAEPALARLCIVEALCGGERVLCRRAAAHAELAKVIDEGRSASDGAYEPPDVTAEGVVGAIAAVLYAHILDTHSGPLIGLLGPLMSIIVLPYLGAGAAERELSRPAPEIPGDLYARPHRRTAYPLEGLNMRLTYRTVRALSAICENPGASNREVADGSGISDPGQISKLLNRLARLKLAENLGAGQEKGAANAGT